jgi:hypothetical protein
VFDYRPDARGSISGTASVQSSSEVHQASYPMGPGVLYSGKERPGRDANHLSPSSAEVKNK